MLLRGRRPHLSSCVISASSGRLPCKSMRNHSKVSTCVDKAIRQGGGAALAVCVLVLCLLPGSLVVRWDGFVGWLLREVAGGFSDSRTQWAVFLWAGAYFLVFTLARRVEYLGGKRSRFRQKGVGGVGSGSLQVLPATALCLASLVTLAALDYARGYTRAAQSVQAVTLLGAVVIGQAARIWEDLQARDQPAGNTGGAVVLAMMILFVGAAVWQPETALGYHYHSKNRWCGPWDNPNTFGLLMGVGVVLAVGSAMGRLVSRNAESRKLKAEMGGGAVEGPEHRTSNFEPRSLNWAGWVAGGFYLAAAGVMGVGLLKSYSRGAWVGAAAGLACLGWQMLRTEKLKAEIRSAGHGTLNLEPRTSNGSTELSAVQGSGFKVQGSKFTGAFALAVVMVSLMVIGCWNLRHTPGVVARRVYSVANANDFSWRNRVAAYEGALQMLADKPWFGFGWNQPEPVYDRYYRAAKVNEGMAIQLNDYFTLGTTLGVPALLCFVMYVGLALTRGAWCVVRDAPPTLAFSLQPLALPAVCRAGAIVLLVGFWFDGGLFKLATGATFWILLELGREEAEQPQMDSD